MVIKREEVDSLKKDLIKKSEETKQKLKAEKNVHQTIRLICN